MKGAVIALTFRVRVPQRGVCHARYVAAHHHFERDDFVLFAVRHIWVGAGNEMVGHNMFGLGKPPRAGCSKQSSLVRHQREYAVKRAVAVARDQHKPITKVIHITHLTVVHRLAPRQFEIRPLKNMSTHNYVVYRKMSRESGTDKKTGWILFYLAGCIKS